MRFEELYKQRTEKRLTIEEAATILGISERTFRRWSRRYEEDGIASLADKRLDRAAHNTQWHSVKPLQYFEHCLIATDCKAF